VCSMQEWSGSLGSFGAAHADVEVRPGADTGRLADEKLADVRYKLKARGHLLLKFIGVIPATMYEEYQQSLRDLFP